MIYHGHHRQLTSDSAFIQQQQHFRRNRETEETLHRSYYIRQPLMKFEFRRRMSSGVIIEVFPPDTVLVLRVQQNQKFTVSRTVGFERELLSKSELEDIKTMVASFYVRQFWSITLVAFGVIMLMSVVLCSLGEKHKFPSVIVLCHFSNSDLFLGDARTCSGLIVLPICLGLCLASATRYTGWKPRGNSIGF
jgi:hypothetical protein